MSNKHEHVLAYAVGDRDESCWRGAATLQGVRNPIQQIEM